MPNGSQQVLGIDVSGKKVILWGTGSSATTFMLTNPGVAKLVIDSDPATAGPSFFGLPIKAPEVLAEVNPSKGIVFVASMFWPEIIEHASSLGFFPNKNLFLATNLSHVDTSTHRGFVPRGSVLEFLQQMGSQTRESARKYVLLRDHDQIIRHSVTPDLSDVDLLMDESLTVNCPGFCS